MATDIPSRVILACLLLGLTREAAGASRIPVFARRYRTSCTTCHTAAPKLNVLGEAFRLNGYRFPKNQRLVRQEPVVPLGDEAWKDLWPRAIWPGEIPGTPGISLRVQSDVEVRNAAASAYSWTYRFPADVYLLGTASLGDGMAAFVEAEWLPSAGVRVLQAKLVAQDIIPALPERALNAWVGLQGLYPLSFADRQIDRAGRALFTWQTFAMSDVRLAQEDGSELARSAAEFRLVQSQPAVELNGILRGRLAYGVGIAQGSTGTATDRNNHKDIYYRLRYKAGGLGLDGQYDDTSRSPETRAGQLYDRSLTLEHFAYWGKEPLSAGAESAVSAVGVSARALIGVVDAGVGWTRGDYADPWGRGDAAHFTSVFGKVERMLLPWLLSSFKAERFVFTPNASLRRAGYVRGAPRQDVIAPGVIALLRANVRLVAEGELYLHDRLAREAGRERSRALWFRLDFAF